MLQVFDDELSRVFFAECVVVVEGDSEILAIRNTLRLYPENFQKNVASCYQLVKARGKAAIISLVKYLHELGIKPFVVHDADIGVPGAERFNQPIADAVGRADSIIVLENCLEDLLGYAVPSNDKPFQAFIQTERWTTIADVPERWKAAIDHIFAYAFE
jgi:hypothetical protein